MNGPPEKSAPDAGAEGARPMVESLRQKDGVNLMYRYADKPGLFPGFF